MAGDRLRILLSGMVAGDPGYGGASWAILQYLLGLRRLGHDVVLAEPVRELAPSVVGYFERLGLDRAALVSGRETAGLPYEDVRRFATTADMLLNVSGMLRDEALVEPIGVRVYLDLDPAFNQLWHTEGIDVGFSGHTHFVTIGQAVGKPTCSVPDCGLEWLPTLPPVVLERWPVAVEVRHDALTTVGSWRGYGSIRRNGVFYGQKAHAMRPLYALPRLTDERFLLALSIHPDERADLVAFAEHGWELADPAEVAGTPGSYQRFLQGSKGELGLAKSGYVVSRCGWFSDRSACYLACGRPVVAMDSGFGEFLPTGRGLFAFTGREEAAAAIDELRADYPAHARAARELAEEHFDSDRVLEELLGRVAG